MSAGAALAELLRALERGLTHAGWRWYVFGAQASMAYGLPRHTVDVDVTVCGASAPQILEALAVEGVRLRRGAGGKRFIRQTRVIPALHAPSGIPVDVVLGGPGLEEAFAERAAKRRLHGVAVPVLSAEDLVVTKLLAGRPKDLDDIRGVLRRQGRRLRLTRIRALLREIEQALDQSHLMPLLDELLAERSRR